MRQTLPPSAREEEDDFPEPRRLRNLRRMVTLLMAVMGLGMIVIAGALAWRLTRGPAPIAPESPILSAASIELPAGREIVALGGDGPRLLIATRDANGVERLMVFEKSSGAFLRETAIRRTQP